MSKPTHAQLVIAGARFLRARTTDDKYRCQLLCTELAASNAGCEIPDVLGWSQQDSVLIECKTSRADFMRDYRKRCRGSAVTGAGTYRFYLTPPGLVDPPIVALPPGWGLLELRGKSVVVVKPALRREDILAEIALYEKGFLLSIDRRLRDKTAIYIVVEETADNA